ncbi:hypothetical protein [Neobacillus cucumis]|nr:hypothetical protein [Neobacillus cucumis]
MMNLNPYKKDENNLNENPKPREEINQEDRVPEFDEIGTALNGI